MVINSKPNVKAVLGKPGSGKSTHLKTLEGKRGYHVVYTGELFRYHIESQTEIGQKASQYVSPGNLVPAGVTVSMLFDALKGLENAKCIFLDGFPRSVCQLNTYQRFINQDASLSPFKLDGLLLFNIDSEIAKRRIQTRSQNENRKDDQDPQMVANRFQRYEEETVAVITHFEQYQKMSLFNILTVDSNKTLDIARAQFNRAMNFT